MTHRWSSIIIREINQYSIRRANAFIDVPYEEGQNTTHERT